MASHIAYDQNGQPIDTSLHAADAASHRSTSPTENRDDYSLWNGDWNGYLQYMSGKYGDEWTDRWFNWMSSEQSANAAREWTANREDTTYQRLVEDLKAAGINPYILLQSGGASGSNSSSSGVSYSGSYTANKEMKEAANTQKWAQLISSIITTVIMVAAFA